MIFILFISTQQAQANNRLFWLLNVKSDLRIILHGLVSINQSENEQSATLHHINQSIAGYFEEKNPEGSPLPKPLCMNDINRHDWNNTPIRKVTFQNGIYGVENIPGQLGGLQSLALAITVVGLFAVPYLTEGQHFHGVEIPSTHDSVSTLIPSLCTVGGAGFSFGSHFSPLGRVLNNASKIGKEHNQCAGVQNENSFSQYIHLLTESQPKNTQSIYIPSIQTQGFYNQSQNELWLLVPNPMMIMLGLIPGSNNNNSLHTIPNRWPTWFW